MRILRGLNQLNNAAASCVASIGNFDGVHLGHQAILRQLCATAKELSVPATVISFEPHPQSFFNPNSQTEPHRLTPLREKAHLLKQQGIEQLVVLPFNLQTSTVTAKDFVTQFLHQGLGIRELFIGDDFRFGHKRLGDAELLRQMGKTLGFNLNHHSRYEIEQQRVSSSRIRTALIEGDLATSNRLLGQPYSASGTVVHGQKLARQLGYHTANINLKQWLPPIRGVFAVKIEHQEQLYSGVANLGTRPTIHGKGLVLETHLFDFDDDLYRQHLRIQFVKKLRAEQAFPNIEQLAKQISRDIELAKIFFRQ